MRQTIVLPDAQVYLYCRVPVRGTWGEEVPIKIALADTSLLLVGALGAFGFTPAAAASPDIQLEGAGTFTLDVVQEAASGEASRSGASPAAADTQTVFAAVEHEGAWAVADVSLLATEEAPATWSAHPEFVDIAWAATPDAPTRTIVVNDSRVGEVSGSSARITGLTAGESHSVQVIASSDRIPTTGFSVYVPHDTTQDFSEEDATALSADMALAATRLNSTTIIWDTFIAQPRVDAPAAGCDYGLGYQFNGNNRTWAADPFGQLNVKTRLQATVPWDGPAVWSDGPFIGSTSVYRADTGALVATRQLPVSSTSWTVSRLGGSLGSTSTYVDVRMAIQAGNPFCSGPIGNSIEGAFTMRVTRSASWQIISGSHRQMPDHQILLHAHAYTGSTVTTNRYTRVYQRPAASTYCLVNLACPGASMTGWSGSY